jgi:hypothetical protein
MQKRIRCTGLHSADRASFGLPCGYWSSDGSIRMLGFHFCFHQVSSARNSVSQAGSVSKRQPSDGSFFLDQISGSFRSTRSTSCPLVLLFRLRCRLVFGRNAFEALDFVISRQNKSKQLSLSP